MSKKKHAAPPPSPSPSSDTGPSIVSVTPSFLSRPYLPEFVLGAVAFLVWASSISNGFVFFDDDKAILYNVALKEPTLSKFFTGQNLGMYAPVSWMAYWLGQGLSGQEPWGYHLLGVLLHALNAVLAFRLLRNITGQAWSAFFAALLFAVHPVQAEAVCWAAALSTVLFSTFYLASASAWWRWRQGGGVLWLGISLGLFLLAGLSKSAAVTLPLLLVAVEFYLKRKADASGAAQRTAWWAYVPFFAISLWLGLYTFSTRAAEGHDIEATSAAFSSLDRFWMVTQTLLFYPVKLLLPLGFSIAYPFVKNADGTWPLTYYAAPLLLAALAFLVWKKWRDRPDLLLGLVLYLLPLTVMLPFRTVGSFELRSDRYVYLSCLGVFFVVGIFIQNLKPAVRVAVLVGAALVLGTLSWMQIGVWKDGVAMFDNCVAKTPESALCQCNLAYNKLISLDFQSAVERYTAALRSDATYIEAYNGRGQAYLNLRQIPQAYDDFNKAIQAGLSSPKLYLNRGKCAVMLGKPQEALPDLARSLELEPREAETWYFQGVAHEKTGNSEAALNDYAKAAMLRPGYVEALTNRGVLLLQAQRPEEALTAFDAGLAAAPNLPMLHNNRANAHLQLGHYEEAVQDASKAIALNAKYLPAYQIRGNAYLKLGKAALAQQDFQQAAALQGK